MNQYDIFIRHPFFNNHYNIEAENLAEAIEIVKGKYNVTDKTQRGLYIISSCFENGKKVIEERKLFE